MECLLAYISGQAGEQGAERERLLSFRFRQGKYTTQTRGEAP